MSNLFDPEDELIALRAGQYQTHSYGGQANADPVMPPIVQASLFRRDTLEQLLVDLGNEHGSPVYSRGTNPTVRALEQTLAKLERGEKAICTASGMGAISASLFALLKAGDHILFLGDIYGPALQLAARLNQFGVATRHLKGDTASNLDEIAYAIHPETRIIYLESPGSNLFRLLPIAQIAALAKSRNIITLIDNSYATPLLQKPLNLGIDLVLHSLSKYVGGHSDALGGAVIGRADLIERIFYQGYMLQGAALSPHDAFLHLRGLMSLTARLARQSSDALEIARYLADHDRVERVFHPALCEQDAPLYTAQMRASSGLFSFCPKIADFAGLIRFANHLRLFGKAISWGGPDSLVMSGHKYDPPREPAPHVPWNLLRLSIGLEGKDTLIADLEQALAKI